MSEDQDGPRTWDDTRERYLAYMQGWSDGASVRAIRPFDCDADAAVVCAYHEGYTTGRNDRHKRSDAAAERFGYDPTVQLARSSEL